MPLLSETASSGAADKSRQRKLAIAAVLVSTVATIAVLELLVRLIAPQNTIFFDDSSFRRNSWEFKPNTVHPGYVGVPIRVNGMGLRGPEIATPKPAGVQRVVMLGDSVTFGFGVRESETFSSVAEASLNGGAPAKRFDVVNTGVPGTGLDYYRYALEQFVDKLDGDVVVMNIAMNDIGQYPDWRRQPLPVRSQRIDEVITSRSHLASLLYVRLKSILYGIGVLDINKVLGYDFLAAGPPSKEQDEAWVSSFAVIDEIREKTVKRGKKFVIVVFPIEPQLSARRLQLYQRQYRLKLDDGALEGKPQKKFVEYGARHGVQVIDLLPAFRADNRPDLFFRNVSVSLDPVHPSAAGHKLAGEAIARSLVSGGALGK